MMINAKNNACFETPVTAVTFSTEKLLFIDNSPILLRPPRKRPLYKATPESLSNLLLFDIPASPRNFRCPPWGVMDIFCNYTLHLPKGGRRVKQEF